MGKRMAAGLLAFVLLVGGGMATYLPARADAVPDADLPVIGPEMAASMSRIENATLTGDIVLSRDVVLAGRIALENGASLVFRSGHARIEGDVVLDGDLRIEGDASVSMDGRVNGTVFLHASASAAVTDNGNGTLYRPNHLDLNGSAHAVSLAGLAYVGVGGSVGTLEAVAGTRGETFVHAGARVESLHWTGDGNVYVHGSVEQARADGSGRFYVQEGGRVGHVRVEAGGYASVARAGVVESLLCEADGQFEVQEGGEGYVPGRVDGAVVLEGARPVLNRGSIGAVAIAGGSLTNEGTIGALHALRTQVLSQTASERAIETLLAVDSDLRVDNQDRSVGRVGKATVHGGRLETRNAAFDRVWLTGRMEGVSVDRTDFYELYLDAANAMDNDRDLFQYADLDEIGLPSVTISRRFEQENPDLMADLSGSGNAEGDASADADANAEDQPADAEDQASKADDEASEAVRRFAYTVVDALETGASQSSMPHKYMAGETDGATGIGSAIPLMEGVYLENGLAAGTWFTRACPADASLSVTFRSYGTGGMVVAYLPDGTSRIVSSDGGVGRDAFIVGQAGTVALCVLGSRQGADLEVDVTGAAGVRLDLALRGRGGEGEPVAETPADPGDFRFSLRDLTDNVEVPQVRLVGDVLRFAGDLAGHRVQVTATPSFRPWEYDAVTGEVEVRAGEPVSLRLVAAPRGVYEGTLSGNPDDRVYLYDGQGAIVGMDAYRDGPYFSFWSLPAGSYTAVFVRDPQGVFRFPNLSSFERFGLRDKRDLAKDTFEMKNGLFVRYWDVGVPEAPSIGGQSLVPEDTVFMAATDSAATGSLVLMTLSYSLRPEAAESVDGMAARFELSAGTEFVSDGVVVGEAAAGDFTFADGVLRVPVTAPSGTVRFYVRPSKPDVGMTVLAAMELEFRNESRTEFVGAAHVEVSSITLAAQDVASAETVAVSGSAGINQTVAILDNGTVVGTAVGRGDGTWSARVSLVDCWKTSLHTLVAVVNQGKPNEHRSTEVQVRYDPTAPDIESFRFYYYVHGQSSDIRLSGEAFKTQAFSYDFWPGSVLTFDIGMSNDEAIETLHVVSTREGEKRLQAFYDKQKDLWIASGIFSEDPNDAPGNFVIRYTRKDGTAGSIAAFTGIRLDEGRVAAVAETVEPEESAIMLCPDGTVAFHDIDLPGLDDKGMLLQTITCEAGGDTPESLLAQGYERVELGGSVFYQLETVDDATGVVTSILRGFPGGVAEGVATEGSVGRGSGRASLPTRASSRSGSATAAGGATTTLTGGVSQVVIRNDVILGKEAVEQLKAALLEGTTEAVDAADEIFEQIKETDPAYYDAKLKRFARPLKPVKSLLGSLDLIQPTADTAYQYFDQLFGPANKVNYENWKNRIQGDYQLLQELQNRLMQNKCPGLDAADLGREGLNAFYDSLSAIETQAAQDMVNRQRIGASKALLAGAARISMAGLAAVDVDALLEQVTPPGFDEAVDLADSLGFDKAAQYKQWKADMQESIDTMTQDAKQWVNRQLEDPFDALLRQNEERAKNIEASLAQSEGNIQELFKKCRETPTPTPSPSPTSKPTPKPTTPPSPTGSAPPPGGGDGGDGDSGNDIPGKTPTGIQWDPSGTVYEAVRSNRISGVTATCLQQQADGSPAVWDAAAFGQTNPQTTDAAGAFSWMVPQGMWSVSFSDPQGRYADATTAWLPVPPPQTEVHVGLVSREAPGIQSVYVSPGRTVVQLNRYVTVDSAAEGFALKASDGTSPAVAVKAENQEASDDGTMLASRFTLLHEGAEIPVGTPCSVTLKPVVTGYNGIPAAESTMASTCRNLPKRVDVEMPKVLPVGETTTLKVRVEAVGAEGLTLACESDDEFLSVESVGPVGSDRRATVRVRANKPGASRLAVLVPDSGVVYESTAYTARPEDRTLIAHARGGGAPGFRPAWWMALPALLVVAAGVWLLLGRKKRVGAMVVQSGGDEPPQA